MKYVLILCLGMLLFSVAKAQDSVYYRATEWKEQIDGYYREDAEKFPEKGQILFVGSSSIRMWHNLPDYFPAHKVLARGFGGACMSDVLYHMQRLVIAYKPAQIVLYAGENDLSNGVSPEDLVEDVKTFVRMVEIQLPGVPVLILAVKPSPFSHKMMGKQQKANQLLYAYSNTKAHVRFIDTSILLLDEQGNCRDEYYLKDRLHINEKAYKRWAQVIEPHLR